MALRTARQQTDDMMRYDSRQSTDKIRSRMIAELAELEEMVASAPADHPAKLALATIRDGLATIDSDWLIDHEPMTVRVMANDVAKGVDVFGPRR